LPCSSRQPHSGGHRSGTISESAGECSGLSLTRGRRAARMPTRPAPETTRCGVPPRLNLPADASPGPLFFVPPSMARGRHWDDRRLPPHGHRWRLGERPRPVRRSRAPVATLNPGGGRPQMTTPKEAVTAALARAKSELEQALTHLEALPAFDPGVVN